MMCNNSICGLHICVYLNGCRIKFIFCPHVYCLQTLSSTWVDILKPRGFKHEFTHRLKNITYNWEIKRLFNTCIHVCTRTHARMCAHTHTQITYTTTVIYLCKIHFHTRVLTKTYTIFCIPVNNEHNRALDR